MRLADPSAQIAYLDQLGALDDLTARKQSLETELFARVDASDYATTAARLQCLRGVGQLTAEIGDFARCGARRS